ncbi:MAG: hypothetical protein R3F61_24595 [Myxococcota bacterium]
MPTAREDFLQGLTTPSVSALAGAAGTVYLLAGLSVALVGPGWLTHGNVRWLASGPEDDYAYVTASVLDRTLSPDPTAQSRETVVILGGSGTRESLTDEADIEHRLAERLGRSVDVLDMTTDAQTVIEGAGLLETVDARPLLVVMGLGGHALATTADDLYTPYSMPRLGFRSPVVDSEFEQLGWPPLRETGWPLVDNRDFYLVRLPYLPVNLLRGGTSRAQHRYLGLPPLEPDQIRTDFADLLDAMRANRDLHLGVVGRSIDRVRAGGGEVVILEAPASEAWFGTPEESSFYAEVRASFANFTASRQVPLWNLDTEARLVHDDFRDPAHLNNTAAQARYTNALVDRIARELQDP